MSLVHNERVKLTAAWLNGMASAAVAAGVIAPLVAAFYGLTSVPVSTSGLLLGAVLWFAASGALHVAARHILGRLRA